MCDEIISYVKRILRGFDLTREKMGLDVIRQVGPGGQFLSVMHTKAHFREEIWQPKFLNRDDPEAWSKKGKRRYEELVTRKALEILESHHPEPLPEGVRQQIDAIIGAAAKGLAELQFIA